MIQTPSPTQQALALNAELLGHRYAYYVQSKPTVSDAEYDAKERQLRELVGGDETLTRMATSLSAVGSDLTGTVGTAKHHAPMLSLDNAYNEEDLNKWLEGIPPEATFVCEPKVDGLSLSARYYGHKLALALTRGDGTQGEDVTSAAMTIRNVPKTIPITFPHDLEIRGEVFVLHSVFDALNRERAAAGKEPYANTRNLASGSLKQKDYREVAKRSLSFQPWQVMGLEPAGDRKVADPTAPGVSMDDIIQSPRGLEHAQSLEYLYAMCRETRQPLVSKVHRREDLWVEIQRLRTTREELWSKGLGMDTDGVVVKVAESSIRRQIGVGSKSINWGIAVKFPAEQAVTTLLGITWQVGRTGKVTPVAELEPVSCSGATVARATINNITYLRTKLGNPRVGDKVIIHRGGEVIPNILGVAERCESIEDVQAPTVCPECGSLLVIEKTDTVKGGAVTEEGVDQRYCYNDFCQGRIVEHFCHIGKREILDIDGLGDFLAGALVRTQVTPTLGALWSFGQQASQIPNDQLDEACRDAGFGTAAIVLLVAGLEKAKTASWDRWLQAMNIPGLGKEGAKAISAFLKLGDEDIPNLAAKLLQVAPGKVDGFGPERCKEIQAWAIRPEILTDLQELYEAGVRPRGTVSLVVGDVPLAGYTIVLTGEFGEPRDSIQRKLESLGAVTKSGVSSKVNLLLMGDGAGASKKNKAQTLGIRTEGKEWLIAALQSGGLCLADNGLPSDEEMDSL